MFTIKETNNKRFYYNDLYYDFIFNFGNIREYYFYDYRSKEDISERILYLKKSYGEETRNRICNILEKQNSSLGCGRKTLENIKSLKNKNTFAVVTGQQPGLITGPIFIIYKALSLIRLCNFLENSFNLKVVPVFWNATDDDNPGAIDNVFFTDSCLKQV